MAPVSIVTGVLGQYIWAALYMQGLVLLSPRLGSFVDTWLFLQFDLHLVGFGGMGVSSMKDM